MKTNFKNNLAPAVIELNRMNEELQAEIKQLKKDLEHARSYKHTIKMRNRNLQAENERLLKIVRRQKYKRCLYKAKWCDEVMLTCELRGYTVHRIWANKHKWAMRWKYRWLALADKFKEK